MKAITKSKGFIPADNSDRTVMLQLKMGKQIEHSTQKIRFNTCRQLRQDTHPQSRHPQLSPFEMKSVHVTLCDFILNSYVQKPVCHLHRNLK